MALRLADRLGTARRNLFIGRTDERTLFETALKSPEPPFCVLHVFGLGGIGKTSLLREYAALCQQHSVMALQLDGRNIEPSPESFEMALATAIASACDNAAHSSKSLVDALSQIGRFAIFIDTYELLTPLDSWLRDSFLPQLPDNCMVVLAGREAPKKEWRLDSGWQSVLSILPLRNLRPDESNAYLKARGVPAEQHDAILDFTYGHPLALSLVTDLFAQGLFDIRDENSFSSAQTPDIVRVLVEHLLQEVPSAPQRAALEIAALVRVTTETLLSQMLHSPQEEPDGPQASPADVDNAQAHELFEWLSTLSFMESGPTGIFPHDLAREALVAELRWRNPDWYAELHRRARTYYASRLQETSGHIQQRILTDYIFLHRSNSVVRPFLEWQEEGSLTPAPAEQSDVPTLLQMVEKHEGSDSARIAAYWFARQLGGVLTLRDGRRQIAGFMFQLSLHETTEEDRQFDATADKMWSYLNQQSALRPGERATVFRFWMADESYQSVCSVQSLVFVNIVRHYLTTPGLAFTFLPCSDADYWQPVFTYADAKRLTELDFSTGSRHFGVYTHDWRLMPPLAWLSLLADRETSATIAEGPPPIQPRLLVLSQPEWNEAVSKALRNLARPALLSDNPLLRSRLIVEKSGETASTAERIATLQQELKAACETLKESPRERKFYAALQHTYLQPAPSQEKAAEIIDVPFSTFRRYLKSGIERVCERLWQQEINGQF